MDITAIQEIRWLGQGTLEEEIVMCFIVVRKTNMDLEKKKEERKHLVMDFTPIHHRTCILRVKREIQ
jgi:hypothetical protein